VPGSPPPPGFGGKKPKPQAATHCKLDHHSIKALLEGVTPFVLGPRGIIRSGPVPALDFDFEVVALFFAKCYFAVVLHDVKLATHFLIPL
jgi:hypothetical protein